MLEKDELHYCKIRLSLIEFAQLRSGEMGMKKSFSPPDLTYACTSLCTKKSSILFFHLDQGGYHEAHTVFDLFCPAPHYGLRHGAGNHPHHHAIA
jgi:hypothetical protein